VNPHALSEQRVGAGDVDGHSAGRRVDADDRLDFLLVHVLVDQEVARLNELGGGEAPLVAAADHKRVFGCRLQAAVDDHESVVLTEADARHAGCDGRRAVQTVVRKPVVLGAVGHIDFEAGHLDGCHAVAGLEVLDGHEAAVLEADEGAEEEAVAAGAGTRPAPDLPEADRPGVLYDRPRRAEVVLLVPEGPIASVRHGGASERVVACVGPERIEPEWWRPGADGARDYYRLLTETGRVLWMRRHGREWSVDGVWV